MDDTRAIAGLALRLMLPTSLLSGVLFVSIGRALRQVVNGDARATGLLTMVNTLGAVVGALGGGFLLLPTLGIEGSLFASGVVYLVAAFLIGVPAPGLRRAWLGAFAIAAGTLACFPIGAMRERFISQSLARFMGPGHRVVAYREGLTETVAYVATDWGHSPLSFQLVTNGHSMAGTGWYGRRYMKLYVYWAMAVHPGATEALLISYGAGNTAKALVETATLTEIDIVDTSRDILDLSAVVYPNPGENPLNDPRVRVHVEDGRFFLQTTAKRFDLITSEPPPPKGAGIASLYSREYFALVSSRLRPGGVVTYWLPVNQLTPSDARSITAAFCSAFADCTLWTGSGLDWMLAGTRAAPGPVDEAAFVRQWQDERVAAEMRNLGLERPEQLGATFIADDATLASWVGAALPLSDDAPGRLCPRMPEATELQQFAGMMSADQAAVRFAASPFVRRIWPAELRARTMPFFVAQSILNDDYRGSSEYRVAELASVLRDTRLQTLPLLVLDSEPELVRRAEQAARAGTIGPQISFHRAAGAIASRDYRAAAQLFRAAREDDADNEGLTLYEALAEALAGRRERALDLLERSQRASAPAPAWVVRGRDWLREALAPARRPE